VLPYEKALVARAMITGGERLGAAEMVRVGCRVLDWLIEAQTASDGYLTTIGNQGWWLRDGVRARFDQQPIEATGRELPILTGADLPYRANAVFNPGAARVGKGDGPPAARGGSAGSRTSWEVQDRLRRANPGPLDAPVATIRTRPMHPIPAHNDLDGGHGGYLPPWPR
jgi:hypothetical protein